MVSFTSITQGIILVTVMIAGSSAAPAAEKKAGSSSAAPHSNATDSIPFKLPPVISSRIQPASEPDFSSYLQAEADIIEKNKKWFESHGGSYKNITKRGEIETKGGMTMDLPENAPPIFDSKNPNSVIAASATQIKDFKFHAALSATAYCRGVVPLGSWSCSKCLQYVPDGKLIVTFTSLISDSNGYVLRSDAKKTIYLVFRGTNSIRNAITVSKISKDDL